MFIKSLHATNRYGSNCRWTNAVLHEAYLVNFKKPSEPPAVQCVLIGYPMLKQPVKFLSQGKETNREGSNRFLVAAGPDWPDTRQLQDILTFIENNATASRPPLSHFSVCFLIFNL